MYLHVNQNKFHIFMYIIQQKKRQHRQQRAAK